MVSMASKPQGAGARQSGQLQSATSILLTRELGYGLGPTNSNYSINYTMKSVRYGTSVALCGTLCGILYRACCCACVLYLVLCKY